MGFLRICTEKWRGSIRLRHTVGLSLVIVTVMGIASAVTLQQQRALIRKAAEDRGLAFSQSFAAMGAAAVQSNLFRIQESLSRYLDQPEILHIDFIDRDNMIMASLHKARIGRYLTAPEWLVPAQPGTEVVSHRRDADGTPILVIAEPLFDDRAITAWVRVIFSMAHVRAKEWEALQRMALVTLALVIAGILAVHVTQRQIGRGFKPTIDRLMDTLGILSRDASDQATARTAAGTEPRPHRYHGELEQLTGVVSQTTELVRRQSQELQKSRALLQAVLDNTTAVIYVKDRDGRYLLVNQQYATLFHVPKEQMVGRTDYDLFPRELAEAFRANDARVLGARAPLELEEVAPHDEGPHTYLSLKFPLCDARGEPYAVCGISTDITRRKRAEEDLQALTASLEQKVRERTTELERARDQALIATRHKSEFLASMSHELRTPLNAVIGFSEVLLERMFGELNEKQDEYLQDILSSGRHLLALINDILDLSKIEAGRVELELGTFSAPALLESTLALVRERAVRHRVTLSAEIDPRLGECTADERKIKQVLLNLLSNAIKFTPERGSVTLTAGAVGETMVVAVRDTGIGIPEQDQPRIFEEFYRVKHELGDRREGTGLGLALAKRFVELHGGTISLQSAVGQGSTFTVTIPIGRPLERASAGGNAQGREPGGT